MKKIAIFRRFRRNLGVFNASAEGASETFTVRCTVLGLLCCKSLQSVQRAILMSFQCEFVGEMIVV